MTFRLLLVAFFMLVASTILPANVIGYGADSNGGLYSIDLTAATSTYIGDDGGVYTGLTISPSGTLYATNERLSGLLFSIDKTTATPTFIGETGIFDSVGLDFNGTALWGSDSMGQIYAIDLATAAATRVPVTLGHGRIGGSFAIKDSNTAFAIEGIYNGAQSLYSTDLTTDVTHLIGLTSSTLLEITGIDFGSDGNLYGLALDGSTYMLDQTTGAATLLGNTGGQPWLGLTIPASATPEPGSLWLVSIALTVAFAVRRKFFR